MAEKKNQKDQNEEENQEQTNQPEGEQNQPEQSQEDQIKALQAENESLKEASETQQQVIEDLQEELENAKKQKGKATPTVEHDKATYRITTKVFMHKGKKYTSEDVQEDEKLVKELIEMKSGILEKIS